MYRNITLLALLQALLMTNSFTVDCDHSLNRRNAGSAPQSSHLAHVDAVFSNTLADIPHLYGDAEVGAKTDSIIGGQCRE